MKIALIGYGKMGHIIEAVACQRGHEVVCIIDKENESDMASAVFASADVAIEFTTPQTAENNIRKAWSAGLPVVCGTTGFDVEGLAEEAWTEEEKALVWSGNFSLGVNLFFALNRRLAELMRPYSQYSPSITETHHIHKLDAPSGTAKMLENDIEQVDCRRKVSIESVREGEVTGIHTVRWESEEDILTIRHEAKSRQGFALGAVIAAEWIVGKQGFYTMADILFSD